MLARTPRRSPAPSAAALALVFSAGLALGDPPSPAPDEPPALAGPRLQAAAPAATLVERDFEGKVRRLEEPADEAALRLLDLSPADRQAVDKILAQRHAIIDGVVVEEFATIVKMYNATDAQERRGLFRELMVAFAPLRERGRLSDELALVLKPEQVERHRELVSEYFRALADEARPEGMDAQPADAQGQRRPDRAGAMRNELTQQIGLAIRRSYERTFGQRQQDFEDLIARLNLTPEQEAVVRKLAIDSAQKQALEGRDEREQRRVFFRIMQELTEEQRQILMNEVRGARPAQGPG